jgi:hypothetical protein
VLAVRWYLRFGLSYRDVEGLLAERGIEVDHVSVHRWVRRLAPLLVDAARFALHRVGDRWFVDAVCCIDRGWEPRHASRHALARRTVGRRSLGVLPGFGFRPEEHGTRPPPVR